MSTLRSKTPAFSFPILIVIAWALVLRTVNLYSFLAGSPYAEILISDAEIFDRWAVRIGNGNWLGDPALFVLPPLYAYAVGLVYTIAGHAPTLILITQSALGVLCSGLIFRIVSERFNRHAGVAAGILYGSLGTLLFYETMLIGTSLAVSLTVAFLFFGERWRKSHGPWALAIAGLCLGLVGLVRPNTLILAPIFFLWSLHTRVELRSRSAWIHRWPLVLGVAVPLAIALLRNGLVAGVWTPLPSHGGINFYMGNHAGAPGWFAPPPGMRADITPDAPRGNLEGPRRLAEADLGRALTDQEVSSYWFRRGLSFMLSEPIEATRVLFRKTRLFLSAHEQPLNYTYEYQRQYSPAMNLPFGQLWFIYPLAVLGIVRTIRRRRDSSADWLAILGVYAVAVIAFHVSSRYRMPALPLVICFAGFGLSVPAEAFKHGRWRAALPSLGALVALLILYRTERSLWPIDRSADPFNLATSYVYKGDFARALPWFEEARDAGGQFPSLYYNLGAAYVATGNVNAAEEAYRKALQIDPGFAEAHTNLGNILFKSGRYEEARQAYGDAIQADSSALNARAALGWVAYTFHREEEARTHWENVLAIVPDHPSALAGMDRLGQ